MFAKTFHGQIRHTAGIHRHTYDGQITSSINGLILRRKGQIHTGNTLESHALGNGIDNLQRRFCGRKTHYLFSRKFHIHNPGCFVDISAISDTPNGSGALWRISLHESKDD